METTDKAGQLPVDEQGLFDALEALRPSKLDQRKIAFEKAYPKILQKLSEGVKDSEIIKVLSAKGILRSRNTYVKWMEEIKDRQAGGTELSVVHDSMQRLGARQ